MEYKVEKNTSTGYFDVLNSEGNIISSYDDLYFAEMVAGRKNRQAENTRLKELNGEMYELLKMMDFIEVMDKDGDIICFCPICNSYGNDHKKDCRFQVVLDKAEGGQGQC